MEQIINLELHDSFKRQTYKENYNDIVLSYVIETDKDKNITLLICTGTNSNPVSESPLQEHISFTYNYLNFAKEGETDFSGSVLIKDLHAHVAEVFEKLKSDASK